MYPIYEVPLGSSSNIEPLGTKSKFWFERAPNESWLFKLSLPNSGEHWAEKLVCELCRALGIPHAEYQLAIHEGMSGVASRQFVPDGARLVLGNELLASAHTDYPIEQQRRINQHTLGRILAVLKSPDIQLPIGWQRPAGITSAFDVFLGYLMLDCLSANQDRHDQNWGVLACGEEGVFLCPTFDHGSALARNEPDATRLARLATKDAGYAMRAYVAKARSAIYESKVKATRLLTLDAFIQWAQHAPAAKQYWLSQLQTLQMTKVDEILALIPNDMMSLPARQFSREIIRLNRERLLALI